MSRKSGKSAGGGRAAKQDLLLALTVGGAPRPLAWSIAAARPARIVFFASKASAKSVTHRAEAPAKDAAPGTRDERGVLQLAAELGHSPADGTWEVVTVPEQDLVPCVEAMQEALLREVDALGPDARVILDFTGGTKLMSAALAIAGQRLPAAQYGYVAARKGAASRDKGGLGVTIDGEEKQLLLDNPRDVSLAPVLDDARMLCRGGSWGEASDLLMAFRSSLTNAAAKRAIEAWAHLCDALAAWDRLDHAAAAKDLAQALKGWQRIAAALRPSEAARLHGSLQDAATHLDAVMAEGEGPLLESELLAAADRRAFGHRWDEAVQLLYRAVELGGAQRLRVGHGIETSNVPWEKLPASFRLEHELRPPAPGKEIKLGVQHAWSLLAHLGDADAGRFASLGLTANSGGRESVLTARNQSILVHGTKRATRAQYKKLHYSVLHLLGADGNGAPAFPEL